MGRRVPRGASWSGPSLYAAVLCCKGSPDLSICPHNEPSCVKTICAYNPTITFAWMLHCISNCNMSSYDPKFRPHTLECIILHVVHLWLQVLAAAGLSPSAAVSSTGNTLPFLVGRVSYAFGLQGPCVSTDTACSSSLVAAHMGHTGEFPPDALSSMAAAIYSIMAKLMW